MRFFCVVCQDIAHFVLARVVTIKGREWEEYKCTKCGKTHRFAVK